MAMMFFAWFQKVIDGLLIRPAGKDRFQWMMMVSILLAPHPGPLLRGRGGFKRSFKFFPPNMPAPRLLHSGAT